MILSGSMAVTVPFVVAIMPCPAEKISILGTESIAEMITDDPSTQYMTFLAPNLSDNQPPAARITPEGKLNNAANMPAVTSGI